MCGHEDGLFRGEDVRRGFIKPFGQAWKEVRYANINGLAIFEGCIILGRTADIEANLPQADQKIASMPELLNNPQILLEGVAIKGGQYRWPNRTIPFVIAQNLPNPGRVTAAIAHWNAKTSIRFVPRASQADYVLISQDPQQQGSASAVGHQGKEQPLILRDDSDAGTVIHELGHSVGLWHEQSRADRDKFVEIVLDTVPTEMEFNFNQHINDGIDLGAYDFGSIMHYPPNAFSLTNDPTIIPKVALQPGVVMGQRVGLSAGDIAAVEQLYAGVPHALV